MNKRETYEFLKKVAVYFEQFEVNPEKMVLWHKVLNCYSIEQMEEQLLSYVKDGHYPPRVADMIPKSAVPKTEETKTIVKTSVRSASQEVVQRELNNIRKILGIKR